MYAVENMGIRALARAFESGQLSVCELAERLIARIGSLDKGERGLNAVIEINPDALELARALDRQKKDGAAGLLHGVPVLLKDNIATSDRMHTSAASLALKDFYANRDAFIAARLRAAGMLILGKTNMTEFANYIANGMPNGYSSRGGQTRCPFNREADPSGSSTGSAVAVAAGFAPVSVGTETCGSIIGPAQANGVVGLKPTKGLVSARGILPISATLDTAGPMARSAEDAALLLGALAGHDPMDPHSIDMPGADYTRLLSPQALRGRRIGVDRFRLEKAEPEHAACFEESIRTLESLGAVIVDDAPLPQSHALYDILTYEFKHDVDAYLKAYGAPIRTLDGLIEFNRREPEARAKYGQARFEAAQKASGNLDDEPYLKALELRRELIAATHAFYEERALDAVARFCGESPAPFTGSPAITLPAGIGEAGMPYSLQLIGLPRTDAALLSFAYAFELANGAAAALFPLSRPAD